MTRPIARCETCGAITEPVSDSTHQLVLGLQLKLGRPLGEEAMEITAQERRLLHAFIDGFVFHDNQCREKRCAS